jgi:ParB-like chromosome segregation protein Spo0J
MSEENENQDGFKAITSQDELNRLIGERIGKVKSQYADYDDLKAKAAKLDEVEQSNKTELQKAIERAEKAEKDLTPTQLQVARLEVALEKGLTATQAKRLVGSTKEELASDADELLADLGDAKPDPKKRDPKKLQSGSKGSGADAGLDGKDRAAALLRQYRASSH